MNHFGEIRHLVSIAHPDKRADYYSIGMAHIENLGSQEGILQAKLEITEYFEENTLFSTATTRFVHGESGIATKTVRFGIHDTACAYRAEHIEHGAGYDRLDVVYEGGVQAVGESARMHNIYNALRALRLQSSTVFPTRRLPRGWRPLRRQKCGWISAQLGRLR